MAAPPVHCASLCERAHTDALSPADQCEPDPQRRDRDAWTTDIPRTKQYTCAGRLPCFSYKPTALSNANERGFPARESHPYSASLVRAHRDATAFRCANAHPHWDKRDANHSSL